jgi:hypothetical protein
MSNISEATIDDLVDSLDQLPQIMSEVKNYTQSATATAPGSCMFPSLHLNASNLG